MERWKVVGKGESHAGGGWMLVLKQYSELVITLKLISSTKINLSDRNSILISMLSEILAQIS